MKSNALLNPFVLVAIFLFASSSVSSMFRVGDRQPFEREFQQEEDTKNTNDDSQRKKGNLSKINYLKQIKPIFDKHCLSCHGPKKAESRFRVDRRKSFVEGGDFGEAWIVPGDSKNSELIAVLEKTHDDVRMPPSWGFVPKKDVATIKQWIDQGAKMPIVKSKDSEGRPPALQSNHWSLQKISKPQPPKQLAKWSTQPIDQFVESHLLSKKLAPSSRARRNELIRRLYLVMLGVPPTPAEVDTFLKDKREDAWQRLVDKVLADSRYGERWAQHWLDIARFGETDGYETNRERPNAWHYRDWVINAFNSDKPYDKFVMEQIAGDVLGEPLGTGFLVCGPHDIVKSPDINLTLMQRQDELADIVHTTSTAFLGLTLGCARCHDHKFDPITQTDYFAIQAVFAGVQHGERKIPLSTDRKRQLDATTESIHAVLRRLDKYIPETQRRFTFVDDTTFSLIQRPGFEALIPQNGAGFNPAGTNPGFRDDPGGENRSANFSVGSYSWWTNKPGTDFAIYRPKVRGKFRIWISWGRGFDTHSKDAEYWLDSDGDPTTRTDQKLLATVNQQIAAYEKAGAALPKQPLWSGFLNAGEYDCGPGSIVILRGGKSGSAITADMVVFEKVLFKKTDSSDSRSAELSQLRKPINSLLNIERIEPVHATKLRFEIEKANRGEPCIDELEVMEGGENVALASLGVKVSASGSWPNDPKHQLKHINDGKYGNGRSWISGSKKNSWVELEFPRKVLISQIRWARDREGKFSDRTATKYKIKVFNTAGEWETVADSTRRLPNDFYQTENIKYQFESLPPDEKKSADYLFSNLREKVRQRETLLQTPQAYIGTFNTKPPATHRLHRGDPMSKREVVSPDAIRVIGSLGLKESATEPQRRLELARWIANKDNSLTARVIVNRIWQHHFGTGIVSTASDFGINGTRPSHPKLLDWLAADLIENQWSLKRLHRKILLSKTWQQSSLPKKKAMQIDADSRFLWRFPPRRLEAESIRDSVVSVSGSMNPQMGGPGFSAFEIQFENVRHYFPRKSFGPTEWRRMVYMTKVRQERESTFGAFDCPDGSQVIPDRGRSTTPLQALNLFNSLFMMQQADILAKRIDKETLIHVREKQQLTYAKIQKAYQLCYSRKPSARELSNALGFIDKHGMTQFCRAMLNSNEFLFIP